MSEQLSSSSLAYRNFIDTCRSSWTRRAYVYSLNYFMDYLRLPHDQYDKLLEKDPKLIQMDICDYTVFLKKKFSPATVASYIAAVAKFYAMNDITTLNWKKIHSFQPEHEKVAEDRPYNHSEIKMLIEKTTQRNRAIILLMSSAGLRVGAIPHLRIRDLEPNDNYQIYRINAYAKSRQKYFSFCTPECRKAIDVYLEFRKRWGERITDDTLLFRTEYDPQISSKLRPISANTIKKFMWTLLRNVGLLEIPLESKIGQRNFVMMNHGFRKFFETNAFKAGMDHMYLRRVMGQKSGLEDAYLKLSEEELLEGDSKHVGYIGIIDQLTIDDSQRLKREVQTLRIEKSKMEKLEQRVTELDTAFSKFLT
jgi:integrase